MKKFIDLHRFFVKESRVFIGREVDDKSRPYPVRGENLWWRKFDPNEHEMYKYTVVDVAYRKKNVFTLRQLIYWPVAYIKFIYYSIFNK